MQHFFLAKFAKLPDECSFKLVKVFFCYLQLTDFGELITVEDDLSLTWVSATTYYGAPEMFNISSKGSKFSTASDIYSLGTFHLVYM